MWSTECHRWLFIREPFVRKAGPCGWEVLACVSALLWVLTPLPPLTSPSLFLVSCFSSSCLVSCFFLGPSLELILRNLSPFPPLHFHPGENVAVSSAKLLLNQRSGRGLTWKSQRKIWIAAAHAISLVFFFSVVIIWFSLSNWQAGTFWDPHRHGCHHDP